ncbi:MAG TPA: ABC transporter permease, partial [Dermatophilaceae bacterium]
MGALTRSKLFWPAMTLVVLLGVNAAVRPSFLSLRMQDGHLYGSLIDILRNGAPTLLVALGMTLVIATRGIDLSVGAIVAIAGAISCMFIYDSPEPGAVSTVLIAVVLAIAVCLVFGVWNGFLVSVLGIQPIIATLILMTAGRGIAMLITNGQIITITSAPYKMIGAGYWATLPVAILIAGAMFAGTAAL